MSVISNNLLAAVQALIGGATGSGITVLEDDSVTQTLPIVPEIARRSLAIGNIGGWVLAVLENVHSGADFEQSSINLYNPAAAAIRPPYPGPVPLNTDVWMLGCSLIRNSGAGGLTGGLLGLNPPTLSQGLGIDDAGVALITTPIMTLAHFVGVDETLSSGNAFGETDQGLTYVPINLRIPRGGTLVFSSEAAAAAEFQLLVVLGLFPAGMGQDVVT